MSAVRRVLVTGGAGFIGSHLCDRLLQDGAHVVCFDDFFTGSSNNINHLNTRPGFELIQGDVSLPLPTDLRIDEIYNLASPASPIHYQRDPIRTTKTIVLGAINVLDVARRTGAKVLQASTSEVYGDPSVHPQPEAYWGNVNPIGPRSCYDEGKRCAETLIFDYRRQYKIPIKVARIFNTYGPRMHPADGRVVSTFVVQALKGEDITIFGSGDQTRSFCYVEDLVEGLLHLMASANSFTGPVNIGNPHELTMLELAQEVLQLTGSRSRVVHRPLPQDDPRQRCPDISMAEAHLGWRPKVQLREGLARTIAYFDHLLRQED